jgi:Type II CAAX prenyl endopeptidase Rce1-like
MISAISYVNSFHEKRAQRYYEKTSEKIHPLVIKGGAFIVGLMCERFFLNPIISKFDRIYNKFSSLSQIKEKDFCSKFNILHGFLAIFIAPTKEENFFRGDLQEINYKSFLKSFSEKKFFKLNSDLEKKMAKVVSILYTSAQFSLVHFLNIFFYPKEYVFSQMYQAFFGGIMLGILKEVINIEAAIAAHMANNIRACYESYLICKNQDR